MRYLVFVALSVLTSSGCSSGPAEGSERGPCYGNGTCDATLACLSGLCVRADQDAAPPADAARDAAVPTDVGPLERRAYVVSELRPPTNASEAAAFGVDLDGDDVVDNALGRAFATLGQGGFDLAGATDAAIQTGSLVVLVDTRASSFTDGVAEGRVLEGGDPMPTPCTNPSMPSTCGMHLTGSGHFSVTPPVPVLSTGGAIMASHLALTAPTGRFPLAFSATPIWVPLLEVRTRAVVGTTGLTEGILAGAIDQGDVDAIVVPALYAPVDAAIQRDCPGGTCVSGSSGESLVMLFDANHDRAVTLAEFRGNALLQSMTIPDLDLFDAVGARGTDGTDDSLSIGLGFTAVGATFAAP